MYLYFSNDNASLMSFLLLILFSGNQEALRTIYSRLNKYGIQTNLGVGGKPDKKQTGRKINKGTEDKTPTLAESTKSDTAPTNPGRVTTPWSGSLSERFQAAIWWILTIIVILAYLTSFLITLNEKPVSESQPKIALHPAGS